MAIYLKELLLGLYLLSHYDYYLERLTDLGFSVPMLLFAGVFGVLLLALWLTAYIRTAAIRYLFALLFFASTLFFDVYTRVSADYLTYSMFVSLIYSGGFIDEALYQYRVSILHAALGALPLLFGIALEPRRRLPLPGYVLAGAPFCGVLLLTGILFMRGGEGARGLPAMYTPLVYLNLFAYEAMSSKVGPREPVSLPHHGQAVDNDIVLIVDESVSGNYLDINVEYGVRTNLKQSPPGATIYNYGYAAAIANCSADTNITLRYGGTRSDYLRINTTMPSIWQYAKKAGLRTVYIDAQRTGGRLQNLMSKSERLEIDEFVQFDQTPVRDRDMAAAQKLIELLDNDTPELVYINKIGAHFPVHDKYPDDFMIHRPALPRGQYADVSDTGERDGFGGQVEDWGRYRNAYKNTLLWNVGEFFARVFAKGKLGNAVLIYTSDHGQDLHERGNPGLDTHCGGDPVVEEGLVPLVVIQGNSLKGLDWQRELAGNKDRSSHYNIFPTLLQLMGYDLTALQAIYGRPLSQHTEDEFTFNTRFNARLGEKANWKYIDLKDVVTPALQ